MTFFDDISWVTHTHSDYFDCTSIYQAQMHKYFGDSFFDCHTYLTDISSTSDFELDGTSFYYNPSTPYPSRLLSILQNLKSEFVFLDHEDMFLLSKPDFASLEKSFAYIRKIKASSLKFVKTTVSKYQDISLESAIPSLKLISKDSSWVFSIQPSIWNRLDLIAILSANPCCNIWQLEERSQSIVKKLNQKHLVLCSPSKLRGTAHFDPVEYPHIATAIFKGKWTIGEHRELLGDVLSSYNINPDTRGFL